MYGLTQRDYRRLNSVETRQPPFSYKDMAYRTCAGTSHYWAGVSFKPCGVCVLQEDVRQFQWASPLVTNGGTQYVR